MVLIDCESPNVIPLSEGKFDKCKCTSFRDTSLLNIVGKAFGSVKRAKQSKRE